MSAAPRAASGLSALIDGFDGVVLDVWGTVHDGRALYPGAVEALDRLRAAGKETVMLSNAPRRPAAVTATLARLGLPRRHCGAVVTSGEAARRAVAARADPWHRALGRRCHTIGADADPPLLAGLDVVETGRLEDAGFILAVGPFDPAARLEDYEDRLARGAALGLPMVCANPDKRVMRGADSLICAGVLAERYEALGGEVRHHGKPHPAVYDLCLAAMPGVRRSRTLAVGDSLETDVAGAKAAGVASALVAGGIHACEIGAGADGSFDARALDALCAQVGLRPDFTLPALVW